MYRYYIAYLEDFSCVYKFKPVSLRHPVYKLYYAFPGEPVPENWMRITRERAFRLCATERRLFRNGSDGAGYGVTHILPAYAAKYDSVIIPESISGYLVPNGCWIVQN